MSLDIPDRTWKEQKEQARYTCIWCGSPGPFTLKDLYIHTIEDCDKSPAYNIKRCNDKLMTKIDGLQARISQLEREHK